MTESQLSHFRQWVAYRHLNRWQRLMRSPIRYPYSRCLQAVCQWLSVSRPVQVELFWGEPMRVVLPDQVSAAIHRYRFFEEGLTSLLLEVLKPGMTFFDIGAHFGYFSLLASTLVGELGQVHSFEPTPSTFAVLERNLRAKRNARIRNVAAWSTQGTIPFRDYGLGFAAFNTAAGGKLSEKTARKLAVKTYDVPAIRIDDYVRETGAEPDFIKLDAEGAEYHILCGMDETLQKVRPVISVEVGDFRQDAVASRDVLRLLLDRGYEPYHVDAGKLVPHQPKDHYTYDNLAFIATGRHRPQ